MSYRITLQNVQDYIKETYGSRASLNAFKEIPVEPLVQRDYGEDYDCTLTSLTAVINYITKEKYSPAEIYSVVEQNAKKVFYNGKLYGTIPIFIKWIFDKTLKYFGITRSTKRGYLKNVGYNWNAIVRHLENNNPIIFSINNDGRKYYTNHTITIVGYREYYLNSNKTIRMLVVHDNWYKDVALVDYDKVSLISAVNCY